MASKKKIWEIAAFHHFCVIINRIFVILYICHFSLCFHPSWLNLLIERKKRSVSWYINIMYQWLYRCYLYHSLQWRLPWKCLLPLPLRLGSPPGWWGHWAEAVCTRWTPEIRLSLQRACSAPKPARTGRRAAANRWHTHRVRSTALRERLPQNIIRHSQNKF